MTTGKATTIDSLDLIGLAAGAVTDPITSGNDTLNGGLGNLQQATGGSANLGNILFNVQASVQDSFDVLNADSTMTNLFNRNTVQHRLAVQLPSYL